jgi:hypothetical protein
MGGKRRRFTQEFKAKGALAAVHSSQQVRPPKIRVLIRPVGRHKRGGLKCSLEDRDR